MVLKVRPHQFGVEWDNHCALLASYAMLDALQDTVVSFGCQGTLLTRIKLAVNPKSQISFHRAAFQAPPILYVQPGLPHNE